LEKISVAGLSFPVPAGLKIQPQHIFHNATRVPAHQTLRTQMLGMETDSVTLAVDWREELVGDPETGALMGGVVTSLLDHATGLALLARGDAVARPGGTMDLRIDYHKPSTRGETMVVKGECYRMTRHVAFVRGKAWHPSRPDDIIAHAAGTYSIDRSEVKPLGFDVAAGESDVPDVVLQGAAPWPLSLPFPALVLQARQTKDFSTLVKSIPYFALLGVKVRDEAGSLLATLPCWPQHIGNTRSSLFHGGVIGALLESAAMLQLLSHDTAHVAKTINFTTEFLRPAPIAEELHARAIVVRMGRRIANVRCEAWQSDPSRIVATAHGNFQLT
jgi:uncharacterized protein (TIGR00369 family)